MVERVSKVVELKNKVLRRFSVVQLVLLVLLFLYPLWFVHVTSPVPNFDNVTQQFIYTRESKEVVKESVTVPHLIGLWVLTVFFVASFVKDELWGEIPAKEAIRITDEHIHYYKDVLKMPEFQGELFVGPGHRMKRATGIIKGERGLTEGTFYSNSWLLDVRIKPESFEPERFFLAEVNAKTGAFYGTLPLEQPLGISDVCPKCGVAFDVKYIITTDVKYWRDLTR